MPRPRPDAVLALSLALPSAAGAIPPPPPVAVVLVHAGGPSEESEQLLEAIGTGGAWFEMTPAPVGAEAFEDCVTAAEAEACVREVLAGVDRDRPPVVVILTRPAPGFYAAWTCIGPGEAATRPARQSVSFDTSRWDNATLRYWHEDRATAAGCVLAAASESGW